MSTVKAPAKLPNLVRTAFARAKANGDLTYFPTQVTLISQGSTPFQLRFSPALANKPKAPAPKTAATKSFNPFESPENSPLFISGALPAHNLVLNKFAVVPEHFILATKNYAEQTHLLEADDLEATYACIKAYHEDASDASSELFAFFNSGPHSGASQPHRHIQLLPVEQMKDGLTDSEAWSVLADRLASGNSVPFRTFSRPISPSTTASELHRAYRDLYEEAVSATKAFVSKSSDRDDIFSKSENQAVAEISYNLAMTLSNLVICPRLAEGAAIATAEGKPAGQLCLNGTVLAGTALVKTEGEWGALRGNTGSLDAVLSKIGLPSQEHVDSRLA